MSLVTKGLGKESTLITRGLSRVKLFELKFKLPIPFGFTLEDGELVIPLKQT